MRPGADDSADVPHLPRGQPRGLDGGLERPRGRARRLIPRARVQHLRRETDTPQRSLRGSHPGVTTRRPSGEPHPANVRASSQERRGNRGGKRRSDGEQSGDTEQRQDRRRDRRPADAEEAQEQSDTEPCDDNDRPGRHTRTSSRATRRSVSTSPSTAGISCSVERGGVEVAHRRVGHLDVESLTVVADVEARTEPAAISDEEMR